MNSPDSPWTVSLREVQSLMECHDVEWAVFGAIAANVYRDEVRTTLDVDLLVSLNPEGMQKVAEAAEAAGWSVRFLHPEGTMLRIVHDDWGAADLVAVEIEYQRTALQRARQETFVGGISASVLSVEDVVIHKLIAGRLRDDADIASILRAKPQMDRDYLDHWIREWEVGDRLAAIQERMQGAPTPPPAKNHKKDPPEYPG